MGRFDLHSATLKKILVVLGWLMALTAVKAVVWIIRYGKAPTFTPGSVGDLVGLVYVVTLVAAFFVFLFWYLIKTGHSLKFVWRSARLFLVAYLVILLSMLWLENALLYFPRPYDGGTRWQVVEPDVEDAQFQAADGTRLHGWYFHHPNPKAVVLFAHGNAGNVAYWSEVGLQWRRDLDVSILVFDYRGYGKSEGSPGEAGLLADGRAARAWLAKRAGVAEDQIVLFGRSIGGGVMVDLATDGARGLILERTFTSIPDAAACHYPWLPVRWLMRNRFDSLAKIKNYHGPLLMSHGDADTIVPIEMGRQLFDAANDPKEWISVAGGEHNDEQPRSYYAAVQRFLAGLPKAPAP